MKKFILFFFCLLFSFSSTKADEGMWLPLLIKKLKNVDLQKMGLQLSADDLYSVNNASLKDAIVSFNGYCTGEMISDQGLLLTNHHCGYDAIQNHSSVKQNYLENGFWAKNKETELTNPGFYVDFLIKMEDVTSLVLAGTDTTTNRSAIIASNIQEITKSSTEDSHYWSRVKSFFGGNEYYLFVYERYNDVRLVGAPPESIGSFGGDTDNWMWPRHTGDFALFRVYTGPDGKPSEYSENNIPLKPKHHLPISLDGVQENDFSMIFGYPGGTDRYLSSFGINHALDLYNPTVVDIRTGLLDILKKHMSLDPEINIDYASKKSRISNYWKYYQGQSKQLKALNVYDQKIKIEADFLNFVNKNEENKKLYGNVLSDIEEAYQIISEFTLSEVCFYEGAWGGPDALRFSRRFSSQLLSAVNSNNMDVIRETVGSLRGFVSEFFTEYDTKVDADLFLSGMQSYVKICPKEQLPGVLIENVDLEQWAEDVYANSIFVSENKMNNFLSSTINMKNRLLKDPMFIAQASIIDSVYLKTTRPEMAEAWDKLDNANRLFIQALMKMYPEKDLYSDANFTMRMTYGSVQGYTMDDGRVFNYKTTLDGVIKKMNNSDPEFVVPEKLVTLFENKDFGPYEENGSVPVCFVSNNDITGGNSGSPVINGSGHLIGCAFDGNWEGMSGDIAFDAKLNRTISVDAKYILFIIDKFAGASHLINEMTLVKSNPTIEKPRNTKEIKTKEVNEVSFGEAFLKAWRAGEKTFFWNGQEYTTERADEQKTTDVVE